MRPSRSPRRAISLVAALSVACTTAQHPAPDAGPPAPAGIAVLFDGSAVAASDVRDEVVRTLAARTGRPVRVVGREPSLDDAIGAAAPGLDRGLARGVRSEARESRCRRKTGGVASAVAAHADVVVRVRLDAKASTRVATAEDRATLAPSGRFARVLGAVGMGDDVVWETRLVGSVERTTFPGAPTREKRRIDVVDRRLGRRDAPPPSRAAEAIAGALDALPAAGAARWDAIARGLVGGGCPALGAGVAEALVVAPADQRRLHAAALRSLAAVRKPPPTAPPPGETIASETDPPGPEPTTAAEPSTPPAVAATPPDAEYSCASLCGLHMVELCNNDRTLWSRHGSPYEATRCGVRRPEGFLDDCYRMQWLSGAYEQSCLRPCEASPEGRTHLVTMLRRSGCLRSGG